MNPLSLLPIKGWLCLGAALSVVAALLWAESAIRDNERTRITAKANIEALRRVQNMEKAHEQFRTMPDRDRCLAIMRDSGLPASACD
jgi:hypothetical protein